MAELGLEPVAVNDPLSSNPSFFGSRAEQFAVIGGSFFEPNLEDIAAAAGGTAGRKPAVDRAQSGAERRGSRRQLQSLEHRPRNPLSGSGAG